MNNEYTFTYEKSLTGSNFYRLKLLGRDGKYTYSKVILLIKNKNFEPKISCFPNPVNDFVTISFPKNKIRLSVVISDYADKIVSTLDVKIGTSQIGIDVSSFAMGIYYVAVNDGTNKLTSSFVK